MLGRHRPDTPHRQNDLTDQAPDPMSMHRTRSPLLLLVPLLTLSASAWSQEFAAAGLGVPPGMKPLNLSLPPQPAGGASFGSSSPAGLDQGADLIRLPDLGPGSSPTDQGRGGRLPYGSGYEARQKAARETSGTGFGIGGGSGGPTGGGLEGSRGGSDGGGFGGHQGAGGGHGGGRR